METSVFEKQSRVRRCLPTNTPRCFLYKTYLKIQNSSSDSKCFQDKNFSYSIENDVVVSGKSSTDLLFMDKGVPDVVFRGEGEKLP